MKKKIFGAILLTCCFCFLSCGKNTGPGRLVQVTGTVTHKGSPVEGATVAFVPAMKGAVISSGKTQEDGTFTLMTEMTPGISPGYYRVMVFKRTTPESMTAEQFNAYYEKHGKRPPQIKDLLPEKYGNADTSGLAFEITKKMKPIEIQLD